MRIWAAVRMIGLIVLLQVVPAQAQQESAIPFCAGYWPLTNDSRNVISDTNHGILIGEAGFFEDSAVVLNGRDTFVSFGSSLSISNSLSLCIWLKPNVDDRIMRVLGKFEVLDNSREYCVFLSQSNRIWACFSADGSADDGQAFLKTTLLPAIPKQEWRHLAITWDSSRGSTGLTFYVDGEVLPSADVQAADIGSLRASASDFTLGAYDLPSDFDKPSLTHAFQGSLCQLILMRGVLSTAEILELYHLGRKANLMPYLSVYLPDGSDETVDIEGGKASGSVRAHSRTSAQSETTGIIYVDGGIGDDSFNGAHHSVINRTAGHGPKKTIRGGVRMARTGDTIRVSAGRYHEGLVVVPSGTRMVFEGHVVIE